MVDECHKLGKCRIELRQFLRAVLDQLYDSSVTRRPNVGANKHWPRLLQYLREIEEETYWSQDERGVRLANKSGRGRVAQAPNDPNRLALLINPDYIL